MGPCKCYCKLENLISPSASKQSKIGDYFAPVNNNSLYNVNNYAVLISTTNENLQHSTLHEVHEVQSEDPVPLTQENEENDRRSNNILNELFIDCQNSEKYFWTIKLSAL